MKKIGLARGLTLAPQQEALTVFFTELGYTFEQINVLDKGVLSKLCGIIVTTAVPEEKEHSAAETQTYNAHFQVVVANAFETDPLLPIMLVSSGKTDPKLIEIFLKGRVSALQVVSLDECTEDDSRLGKPGSVLVINLSSIKKSQSFIETIGPLILKHLRDVEDPNGA